MPKVRILSAGEMKHRISIEQQTPTANDRGGQSARVWAKVADAWAAKENYRGYLKKENNTLQATLWTVWVVRYRSDVTFTESMRVQGDDGLVYKIHTANDVDGRHEYVELTCLVGGGT